jgi:hypothetical protein
LHVVRRLLGGIYGFQKTPSTTYSCKPAFSCFSMLHTTLDLETMQSTSRCPSSLFSCSLNVALLFLPLQLRPTFLPAPPYTANRTGAARRGVDNPTSVIRSDGSYPILETVTKASDLRCTPAPTSQMSPPVSRRMGRGGAMSADSAAANPGNVVVTQDEAAGAGDTVAAPASCDTATALILDDAS